MNRFFFASALGLCALSGLTPSAHAANVTLSIADGRLVEPPSGQKSMIFTVSLSALWEQDVRVQYATSAGPSTSDASTLAQPGFDFSTRRGTLTIPAGTRTGTIEVPILADNQVEKDETFLVTLSNVQGYNNTDETDDDVKPNRSVAKGTIVEPVKGVVLGGLVSSYLINPYAYAYDPQTGQSRDGFDAAPTQLLQSGVTVTVSGTNFVSRTTTNAQGRFTALVRPGTYSVKVENFVRQDSNGTPFTFSQPARNVSVSRDSANNNFFFYGVAGTVGYKTTGSNTIYPSYVRVDARPVGASPTSTPIASDISDNSDPVSPSRGYRFFIPALPPGSYTLTVAPVDQYSYYTDYFSYPTYTVTVPASGGVNKPVARVAIVGTPKTSTNSRTTKAAKPSGSGS